MTAWILIINRPTTVVVYLLNPHVTLLTSSVSITDERFFPVDIDVNAADTVTSATADSQFQATAIAAGAEDIAADVGDVVSAATEDESILPIVAGVGGVVLIGIMIGFGIASNHKNQRRRRRGHHDDYDDDMYGTDSGYDIGPSYSTASIGSHRSGGYYR